MDALLWILVIMFLFVIGLAVRRIVSLYTGSKDRNIGSETGIEANVGVNDERD